MVESTAGAGIAKKAKKAFKAGQAAISTGLLKWYPDFVGGSIKFEEAGKLYKAEGANPQALEAYLMFSHCSEKANEMSGAAEGMVEAAWLARDVNLSVEYFLKADEFFKIGGNNDRGLTELKRFATDLYEKDTEKTTK